MENGYLASVGIQFWLTVIRFFGGIDYLAARGRSERCPKCKGREYETIFKKIDV